MTEEIKSLISGFVMPQPGYIRKTICEGAAYINLKTITNDIINSLNENDINDLKLYYKKEDFKNDFSYDLQNKVSFNIFSNNKPIQNEESFFEILKTEKNFSSLVNPNTGSPLLDAITIWGTYKQKILNHVIIQKFNWVQIVTSEDETPEIHEVRLVMQISSNESARLENGDTLNIRIPHFSDDLFLEKNIVNDILKPAVMILFSKLNFNFTFLIELDPLDD